MIQSFYLGMKLPSLNEFIDDNRTSWKAGSSSKKQVEKDILWLLKAQNLKPIKHPVHMTFTWFEQHKQRDKDNVAFAKKYILDALQKAEILPNDNNKYILGFSDQFIYDGKTWGVRVTIDEIIDQKGETDGNKVQKPMESISVPRRREGRSP